MKNSCIKMLFFMCSIFGFFIYSTAVLAASQNAEINWKTPHLDNEDLASLQRGFKLFMNYCSGCHGLKYARYNGVAQDIGITDASGKLLDEAIKKNLMFSGEKLNDSITTSMRKEDGVNWFGIAPPDLSLVVRSRGANWVYNYLLSFYPDPKKIWGVNNKVYPDVAMPDVLAHMKKQMTPEQFEEAVQDITNFLSYVAEPMQAKRKAIGVWVLLFLGLFTVFAVLLKREYWKDVK